MASLRSSSTRTTHGRRGAVVQIVHYELRERVDVDVGLQLLGGAKARKLQEEDHATWSGFADTIRVAEYLGGFVTVRYYTEPDQEGYGRMKAQVLAEGKQAVPYMRMKRAIRGHLARSLYWDIDMVNAQPCIFSQLLSRQDIERPMLDRYIANREACIAEVMTACSVDRKAAKTLFIRLMFFGGVKGWAEETKGVDASTVPHWIHALKDEMRHNASKLLATEEFAALRKHYVNRAMLHDIPAAAATNKTASMMALHLQTRERECVSALVEAIQADTRVVGGIIYDGVLVEREGHEQELDRTLLAKWERAIRKATNFNIQLEVKALDAAAEWLDAPSDVPDHEARIWDDSWMDGASILSYADMKQRWETRSFKIVRGANYVREEKDDRVVLTEHDLVHAYRHLSYDEVTRMSDGAISVTSKPFITRWINDKTLRVFKEMVLAPPPRQVPASAYNIWTPPEVERYVPTKPVDEDSEGVRMYLTLIDTLCGHAAPLTAYVLDWMAQLFQEPAKKTGIALLLKGDEGVGKNRFTDILRYMLGEDKFMQTANPGSTLYGRFTRMREGKFLITINEANGGDNFSANDVIKDMITCDTFVCEGKGTNAYTMNCFARYVFTTNNDNALKVNPDSRRYLVLDVSSELRGNTDFFKSLTMHMEDAHTRHEFWKLLMARDIRGVDWINHRPETMGQQEMVAMNLPYEHQYIKALVMEKQDEGRVPMSVNMLYAGFQAWVVANNVTLKYDASQLKFAHRIVKLVRNDDKHTGFHAIRKERNSKDTVYVFDMPMLLSELRDKKWITNEP